MQRLIAVLVALVVTLPSFADEESALSPIGYIRVGVGAPQIDQSLYDSNVTYDLAFGGAFTSQSNVAWEVGVGYLGYKSPGIPFRDDLMTMDLSALYRFGQAGKIDVYGRAGVSFWAWGDLFNWFSYSSEKGVGLTYGLGMRTRITTHHGLGVEWQGYNGVPSEVYSRFVVSWIYSY